MAYSLVAFSIVGLGIVGNLLSIVVLSRPNLKGKKAFFLESKTSGHPKNENKQFVYNFLKEKQTLTL